LLVINYDKYVKAVKLKAKRYYDGWRKEKTYSPALKKEVQITPKGWRHISGATGHKRDRLEMFIEG
jgi:hypothetical protein